MNEYRCTRVDLYAAGSVGFDNPAGRQGHYITAENEDAARSEMKRRFPRDLRFTVDLWQSGICHAKGYKRTALLLLLLTVAAFAAGRISTLPTLNAYRAECDDFNSLTPAQVIANLDRAQPGLVNRLVCERMDPDELMGAAAEAMAAAGADEDDFANILSR